MSISNLIAPEADYIIMATPLGLPVKSPGSAVIRGAGSPRKWDVRDGYGFHGGNTVFIGTNLAKFEVDISIWESTHWIDWLVFAKALDVPKGPVKLGVGIWHPVLNVPPLSITAVVVEDVGQFEQDDEGLWTCTIKMIQFAPPLPAAIGAPAAAIPAATKALPTATDAATREIEAKTKVFAALAAG